MSTEEKQTLDKISYSCSLNSTTLTALLSLLIEKGIITQEELAQSFETAKAKVTAVSQK